MIDPACGLSLPGFSVSLTRSKVPIYLTLEFLRMRSGMIATLGLAGLLIMSACSSSTERAGDIANTSPNANANGGLVANSGDAMPVLPADPNAANFTSGNRAEVSNNALKDATAKKTGGPISTAAALEAARKSATPAPDNSTFFAYLADGAHEVRTFNNHHQLLRVEKQTQGDGKSVVKVFLRNGKIVEIDGNQVPQLSMIGAQMILERAGIPIEAPPTRPGPPIEKKSGE
jgi:hypothetical protein